MFEDWWIYILVFGLSLGITYIYRLNLGPFRVLLNILGFLGVVVHELSHYALCKILGVPVNHIRIHYRDRRTGLVSPHGSVHPSEYHRMSFLQSLLVAIAPLFISTWLIMIFFELFYIPGLGDLIYIGIGFLIASLFIGCAPSTTDFRQIYRGFRRSPAYSAYQVTLIVLSSFTVILFLNVFKISLPIEFLDVITQYVLIGIVYFCFKYGFRSVNNIYRNAHHSTKFHLIKLTRKRHRPIKAHKLGIDEPHW
ncbi:MAG: hypothetical protein EU548_03320 [Promethearchaeota archaeon]|nr:MAG: hypothetical protein EU548_03320 [Candidatus Lokiarchaeota archaeon]